MIRLLDRHRREACWLAPFFCLALIALTLGRSWPVFPSPAHSRVVTDAEGAKVAIPLPVRAVGLGSGWPQGMLEMTRSPGVIQGIGGQGAGERDRFSASLLGRIYPQLGRDESIWNWPIDLETLLARDRGYTYFYGPRLDDLRKLGLAAPTLFSGKADFSHSWIRVENAVLGQGALGEAIVAEEVAAYAQIERELRPETLTSLPRILPVFSSSSEWSKISIFAKDVPAGDARAGVRNASQGLKASGRFQDAERILAMDPDIILVGGESVSEFGRDPRWRGLKAVPSGKVYASAAAGEGQNDWGPDFGPFLARWEAELAHPERLQPKVRDLLRTHLLGAYGYRLSDAELDDLLRVQANRGSAGYARFMASGATEAGRPAGAAP